MKYVILFLAFVVAATLLVSIVARAEEVPRLAVAFPVSTEPPAASESYLLRGAWCNTHLHAHVPAFSAADFEHEYGVCVPDPVAYKARVG